ncbi:MAG: bifunctional oligoribonuclease/PAP phosphatase NrnA [Clostridiales bacterium]|nr:bifunctional oligoribonuclease/PAP phosphatase NrnA [Clostridiales bacterium]
MRGSIPELARWLESGAIALAAHVNPDCDTLGSAYAIGQALAHLGARVALVSADEPPAMYDFMPFAGAFVRPDQLPFAPDKLLCVDCADLGRIGDVDGLLDGIRQVAVLDHHLTNECAAAPAVIDETATATGVLALLLIDELGAPLTPDMAICLYAAIATDCGNFSFSNTTPEALIASARCLATGFDIADLTYRLFRARRPARIRLLGAALNGIEYRLGGRLALIRVTAQMSAAAGAGPEDLDGIVNFGVDTEGVELSIVAEERQGFTRFSLRSKERINVAALAAAFGGGGHERAAGCSIALPFGDAIHAMLPAAEGALEE